MNKQIINFKADEQKLTRIGGECHYSSNKVSYIEAHFELGENWSGYDSVRAVWWTDFVKGISTVLDANGVCIVPSEVLKRKAKVNVNLVGSISADNVLTDRLTSYPIVAVVVDADARVESTETAEITPSQFEQFVEAVKEAVAEIKDVDTVELNADYTLTFYFSDGTEATVGPIRGEQGPQGPAGPTGNGIDRISLTSTSGLVKTYTIYFTDGTTTTFTVTDGSVSAAQLKSILPTDTASGSIASFSDGSDLVPAQALSVSLEPIQEGSGTPSPDNVRPISGRTEVETVVSPTTSAGDGTTYTTALGQTVYGGTLDVVSGELVVDRAMVDLGTLNWTYRSNVGGFSCAPQPTAKDKFNATCSAYPYGGAYSDLNDKGCGYIYYNQIFVKDSDYTDTTAFKTAMNGVQLVYELATPQTYQLTPQEVSLITGTNNVWSDGVVSVEYYADIQLYIEKKLN